jgi:uncharacterized membrane protein
MSGNVFGRLDLSTLPKSLLPRWVPWLALALAAAGLAASGYLTFEHYSTHTTLSCPNRGTLNCERVTSSAQSTLFGIPVALLGLGYFVLMLLIVMPPAWQLADPLLRRWFTITRLGAVGVGMVYVFYLLYAELFIIKSICIWCTAVHITTFALFVLVAFATAMATDPPAQGTSGNLRR